MDFIGFIFYKIPIIIIPFALFMILLSGIKKELWTQKWICLGLLIPVLWVFKGILFSSTLFVAGQSELGHLIPLQDGWKNGMLSLNDTPFWYDNFSNGHPLHASPISLFFYPFNWILLIGNIYTALSWYVAIHFWLGAVFFALLINEFELSKSASIIAGYAYVMNEWMLWKIYSPSPMYALSSIWLPVVTIYLIRYLNNKDRTFSLCGLSISLAFLFIANFNVFMYSSIILFVIFIVYLLLNSKNRDFRHYAFWTGIIISVILFILIISPKLLPTLELMPYSGNARLTEPVSESGLLWGCEPKYCRDMGLSIPKMIRTFLGTEEATFGTHFGFGKLITVLTR